jgi:hypothetical protein
MQKEELEQIKNWLVGDEKGVKYAEVTLSPMIREPLYFRPIQMWNHPTLMFCI